MDETLVGLQMRKQKQALHAALKAQADSDHDMASTLIKIALGDADTVLALMERRTTAAARTNVVTLVDEVKRLAETRAKAISRRGVGGATKAQMDALARGRKLGVESRQRAAAARRQAALDARPEAVKQAEADAIAAAKRFRKRLIHYMRPGMPRSGPRAHVSHAWVTVCDDRTMFGSAIHQHRKVCTACNGAFLAGLVQEGKAPPALSATP